jgi:hypothetical protein
MDLVIIEVDTHNMFFLISREELLRTIAVLYPEMYPSVAYYTKRQFV